MPLYFFDLADDTAAHRDEDGVECQTREAAQRLAVRALTAIFADSNMDSDQRTATIRVRDASGEGVYAATLRLNGHRLTGR